jgi:hypothetical protein
VEGLKGGGAWEGSRPYVYSDDALELRDQHVCACGLSACPLLCTPAASSVLIA